MNTKPLRRIDLVNNQYMLVPDDGRCHNYAQFPGQRLHPPPRPRGQLHHRTRPPAVDRHRPRRSLKTGRPGQTEQARLGRPAVELGVLIPRRRRLGV